MLCGSITASNESKSVGTVPMRAKEETIETRNLRKYGANLRYIELSDTLPSLKMPGIRMYILLMYSWE